VRAPRLPHIADAPQFLIWNSQFFKRAPYHIALTNGVFLTDRFVQGRGRYFVQPNHRFFTKAVRPFAFAPDATCPTWLATLENWLPEDSVLLLQEWFGYTQVFDHRYEKFAFWIGPSRTGKSTAKNVHEQLLGKENVSNIGLERFGIQFGLEESVGRLLNVAPDVGTLSRVAEGNIKALVSGDRISFDRKYEKAISVEPTARLQFLANEWPKLKDRSDAIFDRLLVIVFENTIPEDEKRVGSRDAREYHYEGIRVADSDAKRTIRFAMKEFRLSRV
jgi:putative DNA primase/helicase